MELYRRYPKLTTVWCFVEVFVYAGHLFGWSSLLFVLKSEGFYLYLCSQDIADDEQRSGSDRNYTQIYLGRYSDKNNKNSTNGRFYSTEQLRINGSNYTILSEANVTTVDDVLPGCIEQESKLNLWFSIAIFASYFACAFLGPLLQKTGVFLFRIIFMCSFLCGAACLAFASPSVPWLICPGLCCIGIAGMALYTTNIQTSFLFPRLQSTITSVFVGLYDASTIFTQLVKVAFENGFSRQTTYVVFSIAYVLILGCNTVFFMPRVRLNPTHVKRDVERKDKKGKENEQFLLKRNGKSPEPSLCYTLVSAQYILHVYWMSVQGVRFVTFLGFLNAWLASRFHGNKQLESYYLSAFSYTTLGTAVSAITAGLLHDCQRRKFIGKEDYTRKRLPIVLPLVITTLLSIITTALIFVTMETILYLVFIFFTIYRSYLFSFEVTFINDAFPMEYFTVLFGVLHSSAGLSGLLQFPLFQWYQSYDQAPLHVNTFLIGLEVTALIHPFYIWFKCMRHTVKSNEFSLNYDLDIVADTKNVAI